MTKMRDLEKGLPEFKLAHKGAFSPDDETLWRVPEPTWLNGETIMFTCTAERTYADAMNFAERETGNSDWLYNSPKLRKDGLWVWILIR